MLKELSITLISLASMLGLLSIASAQDESGLTIEYGYTAEISNVLSAVNGPSPGPLYLSNVDLVFELNTDGLGLWRGGTLNAYFLSNLGDAPSEYMGDAQVTSNIEADGTRRLYEFWYNQAFADGLIEVLVGVHDLNSEYYTNEAAGLFTNSSFGVGADMAGSVPVAIFNLAAASARVKVAISDNIQVQGSVYDGDPGDPGEMTSPMEIEWSEEEGLMSIFEAAYWVAGQDGEETPQAYRVGLWHHSGEFASFDDTTDLGGITGMYFSIDQPINDYLTSFVVVGFASSDRAEIPAYIGFGAHTTNGWVSILGGEEKESTFGLAVAIANIKAEDAWEIAIEATWHVQINELFSIQPDFQYVINAGGSGESGMIFGIRTSVGF